MKLNLDVICDWLPDGYRAKCIGPKSRQLRYTKPLPYARGDEMGPDRLYIARSSDMPAEPVKGAAVICIGNGVPQGWVSGGARLLHLENCAGFAEAVREVFEVFDKFDAWDSRLRDELEEVDHFDIKHILQLGVEMLHNPISIAKYDLSTSFYCTPHQDEYGVKHVRFYDDDELPGLLNTDIIEKIKNTCELERSTTVPYMSNVPTDGFESYCSNLYIYGHYMGCIALNSMCRPFRESDFPLADHLFRYLQKAFRIHQSLGRSDEQMDVKIMLRLLDGQSVTAEDCAPFALNKDECWLFFSLKEKRCERCLPKEYMCEALHSSFPGAMYGAIYREEVVGMLRINRMQSVLRVRAFETFGDIIHRMGYFGGISHEFTDVREVQPYFRQAKYTVENAALYSSECAVNYFKDCALQYLLSECCGDLPQSSICPRGLLALAARDREKGSEYVKTLDTYLQTECNGSHSAELLYIHRSSFNKRMTKTQQILDMDLEDASARLLLRICLRLLNGGAIQ